MYIHRKRCFSAIGLLLLVMSLVGCEPYANPSTAAVNDAAPTLPAPLASVAAAQGDGAAGYWEIVETFTSPEATTGRAYYILTNYAGKRNWEITSRTLTDAWGTPFKWNLRYSLRKNKVIGVTRTAGGSVRCVGKVISPVAMEGYCNARYFLTKYSWTWIASKVVNL